MTHNSRSEDSRDNWLTPPEFLEKVVEGLGAEFDFDATATANTSVAPLFTHDLETTIDDGYFDHFDGYIWCNPPFNLKNTLIPRLIQVCRDNTEAKLVMLVPVATETKLWRDWVWQETLIFMSKRLSFLKEETRQPAGSPAFACALLCMNLQPEQVLGVHCAIDGARLVMAAARCKELFNA